ncbi:polyribonucleotide nucleotidyltransferase [symbiont of Argiope bruennichi]|uniref:polyribonucleotide nucleotidyltransferase n=1 Tax=symbiont of Argiope bruennichi TaxID=2810479 RepID=UPI003DA2F85C
MVSEAVKNKILIKDNLFNKPITIKINSLAFLTDASLFVEYEKNAFLITVTINKEPSKVDFLPLQVNVIERMYSSDRIPGNFSRRELKPSDNAVLFARLIDRTIRPLFKDNFNHEIQINIIVFAIGEKSYLKWLLIFFSSIVLKLSVSKDFPLIFAFELFFNHFSGNLLIEAKNDQKDINFTFDNTSSILFSGPENKINMIEFDGPKISIKEIEKSLDIFYQKSHELNAFFYKNFDFIKKLSFFEWNYREIDPETKKFYQKFPLNVKDFFVLTTKEEKKNWTNNTIKHLSNLYQNHFNKEPEEHHLTHLHELIALDIKHYARKYIIEKKIRFSNRNVYETRNINIEILPYFNSYGSCVFERGETQVISVVTLNDMENFKIVDDFFAIGEKYFFHHYNFLPFSVNEVRKSNFISRREIGHGNLAEKALKWIIPDVLDYPFTIRVVTDVLSSNGSTSQASICASCLALLCADVPVLEIISGISIGLISENDNYQLLVDIEGVEDHFGDMDFKISSSKTGFYAIQLDTKTNGLSRKQIIESLNLGFNTNLKIINLMESNFTKFKADMIENKKEMKNLKFKKINVDKSKLGLIIGTSGKTIKEIIRQNDDAKINIKDDGSIFVYHTKENVIEDVIERIKKIATDEKNGTFTVKNYRGKIIKDIDNIIVRLEEKNWTGLLSKDSLNEADHEYLKLNNFVNVQIIGKNEKGYVFKLINIEK